MRGSKDLSYRLQVVGNSWISMQEEDGRLLARIVSDREPCPARADLDGSLGLYLQ
jgi:hypothetical protein